jgi:hypothetical protein
MPFDRIKETTKDGFEKAVSAVGEAYFAALNWKNNSELSNWLTDHFSNQYATVVSKAMDAEYLRSHVGGAWHRICDGGHSLGGCWKAASESFPDYSALDKLGEVANEYWKDLITPRGMPIIVLDHVEQLNEYFKHLDCVNVAQLIGGEICGVSLYCNWNDPAKLVASSSAVECSGVVYANVIAPLVGLIGIGRAFFLLRNSEQKELHDLIAPALKGLARGGTSILVISIVPGGFLLHLSCGIVVGLAHNYVWEKGTENKDTIVKVLKGCLEYLQLEYETPEPIMLVKHPPSAPR